MLYSEVRWKPIDLSSSELSHFDYKDKETCWYERINYRESLLTACILTNMRSVGAPYVINIHTELAPVCEDYIKKTDTLRERSIPDNRKRLPALMVFFDGIRECCGY